MKKLVVGIAQFVLMMACGLALGYGAVSAWQWHQQRTASASFLETNVHAGNHADLVAAIGHGQPVMVVLKGCHYCALARVWLKAHHQQVQEVAIGSQPRIEELMQRYDDHGTPTLIMNDALVVGFDAGAWAKLWRD